MGEVLTQPPRFEDQTVYPDQKLHFGNDDNIVFVPGNFVSHLDVIKLAKDCLVIPNSFGLEMIKNIRKDPQKHWRWLTLSMYLSLLFKEFPNLVQIVWNIECVNCSDKWTSITFIPKFEYHNTTNWSNRGKKALDTLIQKLDLQRIVELELPFKIHNLKNQLKAFRNESYMDPDYIANLSETMPWISVIKNEIQRNLHKQQKLLKTIAIMETSSEPHQERVIQMLWIRKRPMSKITNDMKQTIFVEKDANERKKCPRETMKLRSISWIRSKLNTRFKIIILIASVIWLPTMTTIPYVDNQLKTEQFNPESIDVEIQLRRLEYIHEKFQKIYSIKGRTENRASLMPQAEMIKSYITWEKNNQKLVLSLRHTDMKTWLNNVVNIYSAKFLYEITKQAHKIVSEFKLDYNSELIEFQLEDRNVDIMKLSLMVYQIKNDYYNNIYIFDNSTITWHKEDVEMLLVLFKIVKSVKFVKIN